MKLLQINASNALKSQGFEKRLLNEDKQRHFILGPQLFFPTEIIHTNELADRTLETKR